ncbi:MAG: hypothetical protein ACREPR_01155 [Brasilonema sp.]
MQRDKPCESFIISSGARWHEVPAIGDRIQNVDVSSLYYETVLWNVAKLKAVEN